MSAKSAKNNGPKCIVCNRNAKAGLEYNQMNWCGLHIRGFNEAQRGETAESRMAEILEIQHLHEEKCRLASAKRLEEIMSSYDDKVRLASAKRLEELMHLINQ